MAEKISPPAVNMKAVGRVSSRVNLTEVRLVEVTAKREADNSGGKLESTFDHNYQPIRCAEGWIEVGCFFHFTVSTGEAKVAEAHLTYHLFYELSGDELPVDDDLKQFASANGAYHSWPFVREML